MTDSTPKFIAIDEEGFPLFGELRVTDPNVGAEIIKNMYIADNGAFATKLQDEVYIIEAFDAPWVIQSVSRSGIHLLATLPYHQEIVLSPSNFTCDEWDRFHGTDESGVTYVFSRQAQAQLFDLADEFSDDSITINGQIYSIGPWLESQIPKDAEKFWSEKYSGSDTGWELNQPAPALKDMLPRLKLPKSRVLVLGCGTGNDAAYFAEQGHVVTAVDISPLAIQTARQKYGHLNINWLQSDLFALPRNFLGNYDLVFEHTCFCAVDPTQRNALVKVWRSCLAPGGLLMGVFYTLDKAKGPPFGGTEWEVRQRLQSAFQFLFWGRWKGSLDRRSGKELFVYAKLKSKE